MAAQMTAKELAKMVQLCGRAEDQGIIDDEDVKQLIKAMDDAALPTMVREENWRKAHERRKKRNNKPETPEDPERYIPFYEKEARLDNAVRMLQDKLTANTPKGEALKLFRRAAHGNDSIPVAELIPSLRETLRISEADLSQNDLENMIKATTDRFADANGDLDLEWMSSEAERLMKTWEVERQTEKRLVRETPMQRSRRIKREQTQMSAAELKERRDLEKAAQKKIDRRKRVVERLDDKSGIDAETGEPVQIEEEVHERTDQIRWKTGHLTSRAYAEGPPVRPPGSPPEAAKRKAAKMRASGQHWGTW
jgi:hypothetical protein